MQRTPESTRFGHHFTVPLELKALAALDFVGSYPYENEEDKSRGGGETFCVISKFISGVCLENKRQSA